MAAKGGESRTGLVVFLVLFILLSIGLGVTTYYGYDAADKAAKDKAEADKKAKAWEDDANFYHYIADTYRLDLGFPAPAGDEVPTMRTQYGSEAGAKDKAKADDHKKLIDTLDKEVKYNDTLKKPDSSFQEQVADLKKQVADKDKAIAKANKERDDATALAEANKREVAAARVEYQKKLDEQKVRDSGEVARLSKQVNDQQKLLDEQGNRPLAVLAEQKKDNDALAKKNVQLTNELKVANKTISDRADEIARSQSASEIDVSKIAPESLAKIVSIGGGGDTPYISLGSADNLKRGVTFSVYGKGVDGKPLKEPKGKLEVIRVTGERVAQARITELRDERRDPVLPGDFIYNPAWNPNVKQHVAIVGNIDLTGDRREGIQDFIRTLKGQGVEVDAYMDMRTGKLMNANGDGPGEITRRTDLLILGDAPQFAGGVVKVADPKAEAQNDVLAKMQAAQDDAAKKGVRMLRLGNFLEMSGYPVPKGLGNDSGKIGFQRNLEAAGSPVDRHEKPK